MASILSTFPSATPRMTEQVYRAMRDEIQQKLFHLFGKVATPFEAPGKFDYGDVDILVADPLDECWTSAEKVATELNAPRWARNLNSPTTSYAVPSDDAFVQVDLHLCTAANFDWQVFHQSHGDFWNLIGTSIRPKGLTANNDGLYLRIEEIEKVDRKRSLIFLTRSPVDVIRLLSIDHRVLEGPLSNIDELYGIVSKSRFFDSSTYLKEDLKANDRKRLNQRQVFRNFVQIWVPARDWTNRATLCSREQVAKEMLTEFGRTEEYQVRLYLHRKGVEDDSTRKQVKAEKRQAAAMDEEYANAWIAWLSNEQGLN